MAESLLVSDVPAVYGIVPGADNKSLQIDVHTEALSKTETYVTSNRLTEFLRKDLGLQIFSPMGSERWGFGGGFTPIEDSPEEGWKRFCCLLPGYPGRVTPVFSQSLFETSANLNVLLGSLSVVESGPYSRMQLFEIFMETSRGRSGCGFAVTVSKRLAEWIDSRSRGEQYDDEETAKVIKEAYSHMAPLGKLGDKYCKAIFFESRMVLQCPGDACDLGAEWNRVNKGAGYMMSTHNCDNPAQQLALLMGLASVHQQARLAGY